MIVALGIIYGDIGTSPLYVLKAVIGDRPVKELLIYGGTSCVFWTLTFQTTLKYIYLTLKADNHGEGGIFSLYALVRRYGKYLVIPTILGATTLLADGIITPPISVASAVEGLTGIKGLEHLPTVPIVIAILSVLFFFQRFGTYKVGSTFGPAMLIWFSMLCRFRADSDHAAPRNTECNKSRLCASFINCVPARILAAGRRVPGHHRRRSTLFGPGPLRRKTSGSPGWP